MPGMRADLLKDRRVAAGFEQAEVAALLPLDDGTTDSWPRALLSFVETRKAKVRGLTPMYRRALEALEHVHTHPGCAAFLGGCSRPHISCTVCVVCSPPTEGMT